MLDQKKKDVIEKERQKNLFLIKQAEGGREIKENTKTVNKGGDVAEEKTSSVIQARGQTEEGNKKKKTDEKIYCWK